MTSCKQCNRSTHFIQSPVVVNLQVIFQNPEKHYLASSYLLATKSFLLARNAAADGFRANCDRRQGLRIAVDKINDIVFTI